MHPYPKKVSAYLLSLGVLLLVAALALGAVACGEGEEAPAGDTGPAAVQFSRPWIAALRGALGIARRYLH